MPTSSQVSWWSDPRDWLRHILHLDDSPHAIALGTAIGVFVAFTPTVGIQMVIVMALALVTRPLFWFNRVAALVAVYISNPFTVVPIYWGCYRVGAVFTESTVSREEFSKLFQYDSFATWWQSFKALFAIVGTPLLLGSLVVGAFFGLASYPLMRRLVEGVQRHRRKHRQQHAPVVESPTGK